MNVYLDLSIIAHVFIYITSMCYAIIINDKVKHSAKYKINSFFIMLILFLINMFYLPYIFFFAMICKCLLTAIFFKKYLKTELLITFFYYLNDAFLLLIGGSIIHNGIFLICIPYISLFLLVMPILIVCCFVINSTLFSKLKKNKFIIKGKLYIDDKEYIINGYMDSGNQLLHNNIPVIFVKENIKIESHKEEILLRGIDDTEIKYQGVKADLLIKNKTFKCYVICLHNLKCPNKTNSILNVNLIIGGERNAKKIT